jgi:hypothetical protein
MVRLSRTPFVFFGILWGGLSLLHFAGARGEPSFLFFGMGMLGIGAGSFLWLSRYKLELTDGILSYRTLFTGMRSLPVQDIARLRMVRGYQRSEDETKTFFRLIVEPRPGAPHDTLSINVNVFRRDDIEQLKQVLSDHGVDVRGA